MSARLKVIQGGLSLTGLPRVVTRIHSRDYWEKEYARLTARLERIRLLNEGRAEAKVVKVKGGWVKRHRREPHERVVITKRKGRAA